ncbi:MAG: metal-dependent hydrolase [Phycisphaerae bacterium]
MDTLTQGLLGAATAQLGFRQKIGRDATWVAAFAGTVPDLDVFIGPLLELSGAEVTELTHMVHHRGLSHSLLMVPVLALPIALVWWYFRRKLAQRTARRVSEQPPPEDNASHPEAAKAARTAAERESSAVKSPSFLLLYACVFVAVLSHPLLDWTTSYGTQLLAPLTRMRFSIDAAPIVDIIYTPLLILTLLTCYIVRKIRHGKAVRATLVIGWLGVLLSTGYLAAGRVMHDIAVDRTMAAGNYGPEDNVDAYPMIGTIFLWRTVAETPDRWDVRRVHIFDDTPPEQLEVNRARKIERDLWVQRAEELDETKTFQWFAAGRLRRTHKKVNGHHLIEFHDMRYGSQIDSITSLWSYRVTLDDRGNALDIERVRHFQRNQGFSGFVGALWEDIWTPTRNGQTQQSG